MRRMRSTLSFGPTWPGAGLGLSGVFFMSSGDRKPALALIIRTTVSQDMATAFRIIRQAATT